jgi:DNA polymerase-3 subunit gamma/tau
VVEAPPAAAPIETKPAPVAQPVAEAPAPIAEPEAARPAPIVEPEAVAPEPQPVAEQPAPGTPPSTGSLTIADVRRLWPEILDKIRDLRRFAWVMLSQNAQVTALDGSTLTIALVNAGARDSFINSRSEEYVQQALHAVLGVSWKIEAIVDPGARPGATGSDEPASADPSPAAAPRKGVGAPQSVREALRDPVTPETREDPDATATRDDPVVEQEDIDPEDLLTRELGAQVIDESRTD